MIEKPEHTTQLVNRLHDEYDEAKNTQRRATRIKRAAAGTVLAAGVLVGLDAANVVNLSKDARAVTWVATGAAGAVYSGHKRKENASETTVEDKLREATTLSNPAAMGDLAAPLQDWITEASPKGTTSVPVELPLMSHNDKTFEQ